LSKVGIGVSCGLQLPGIVEAVARDLPSVDAETAGGIARTASRMSLREENPCCAA
jgi:hypothetical protein